MENGVGGRPAFDPATVGTYTLRFWAVDTAGNESGRFDITVKVQDTTAPTLNKDQIVYEHTIDATETQMTAEEAVELFTDPSYASDLSGSVSFICDEEVMQNGVDGYAPFDSTKAGTYVLRFYAVDASGNQSESFDVKVTVKEQVNVTNLTKLVDYAKGLDLDLYREEGKPEFIQALADAEAALANAKELTQDEIDVAADNLLMATLNLRLQG